MKQLVIIGSSGHAKVIIELIERLGGYNILGLIDDYKKKGSMASGYQVLGTVNEIEKIIGGYGQAEWFIAVGDSFSRGLIYKRLESLGLTYAILKHPYATIAKGIHIGAGTVIMAGAIINAGTFIGEQVIINTGAIVEHDNSIMDFASLSPRSVTGGNVHIGKFSFIGLGAIIKNKVTIGEHTVIGAGSTVLEFVRDRKIAYGIPCKEISDREKDSKYL